MTEQAGTTNDGADQTGELRNKLIKRLAVAGVLVAVLLGVLAFFDYLSTAPEEPDEEVFTKPVPVPPKKTLSQPVTPSSNLPEPPPVAPAVAEAPPPPQVEPAPAKAPEVKPDAGKLEARPENRVAAPSTAAVAKTPVVAPPAMPAPAVLKPVRPVPESTAAPVTLAPEAPAATAIGKPAARVVEPRPAPVAPSGVSRLFSGFLLQAGVFTSPQRAEELHARLTLSGVPSTLETRVQVGPFRTRQEAEAAQAKLKALGIETVLLPPPKGRH